MKLHEKVKEVRKKKNVPQSVLAEKLNITVQGYSMKENGRRPITTDELEIIADTLGVNVSIFYEKNFNEKLNKTTA